MVETETRRDMPPDIQPLPAEGAPGIDPDLISRVTDALDQERSADVQSVVSDLHPALAASLIAALRPPLRVRLIEAMQDRFDPQLLLELDEVFRDDVVACLGPERVARAIDDLESDDALNLVSSLDEEWQDRVLGQLPSSQRTWLEEGFAFPEDSAGRLMQREFVAVPSFWTVGEVIDYLRENRDLPDDFYDIFVVDPRHRLLGSVALNRILRTRRAVPVIEIMTPGLLSLPVAMDQEEVALLFAGQDLVSAPVVDESSRLIGVITIDDIVDVIHEEAEEDIMRLGGVQEDDLYEAVIDTGKARFAWLSVNLLTAIVASLVIGLFQGTIEQIVMLAVLMPIAASMGGNAGTQTLTVAVRAIAMKELTSANTARVLSKETLVGLFNGLLFAVIVGLIAWIWSGEIGIGIVMALAMTITMVIAGLAGAAIPLGLARTRLDPAITSGVFVTTVTDVVAFLAFLGLGAWLLL